MIPTSLRLDGCSVRFVPRDLWIGVFLGSSLGGSLQRWRTVYVCLVPMLPICLTVRWRCRPGPSK
jgi:hypothetical protein